MAKMILLDALLVTAAPVVTTKLPLNVISADGNVYVPVPPNVRFLYVVPVMLAVVPVYWTVAVVTVNNPLIEPAKASGVPVPDKIRFLSAMAKVSALFDPLFPTVKSADTVVLPFNV